jgi:hypothetical protein
LHTFDSFYEHNNAIRPSRQPLADFVAAYARHAAAAAAAAAAANATASAGGGGGGGSASGSGVGAISEADWRFYLALSMFRITAIAQGVYKRSLQGNASSTYANMFEALARCK